jgi:hypothetical protein
MLFSKRGSIFASHHHVYYIVRRLNVCAISGPSSQRPLVHVAVRVAVCVAVRVAVRMAVKRRRIPEIIVIGVPAAPPMPLYLVELFRQTISVSPVQSQDPCVAGTKSTWTLLLAKLPPHATTPIKFKPTGQQAQDIRGMEKITQHGTPPSLSTQKNA